MAGPSRGDLVAALNVGMVLVPQSLAYAMIAGLDPVYGLYAAVAAPLAGALVGSSPYLQTGPVAVSGLLTYGALAPFAEPRGAEFAALAAVLALVVGVVRIALGLLRAGAVAYLMSQPVVVSFTTAGALLIISTQLPGLLGVASEHANPLAGALVILVRPAEWALEALVLGLGSLVVLRWTRRVWPLFPGALFAVVIGTAWSRVTGYEGDVVGDVDLALALPTGIPFADLLGLLLPGLVIAVVGFAEPASIARKYAAQDRTTWDADREFVGQGLANVAAGLAGSMPVGGSFSRTALNRMSGATSRWSGALTGLVVLLALPAVDLLAELPVAVLAGIVIGSVLSLVDLRAPRQLWTWSRVQFGVGAVTLLATLALAPRVERGVLVGVAAALVVHLWRELHVAVPAEVVGQVLHLRPAGVLYFASAPAVEVALADAVRAHPDVRQVVLHLDRVGRLDLTGALAVAAALHDVAETGREVRLEGGSEHARSLLARVLSADP